MFMETKIEHTLLEITYKEDIIKGKSGKRKQRLLALFHSSSMNLAQYSANTQEICYGGYNEKENTR